MPKCGQGNGRRVRERVGAASRSGRPEQHSICAPPKKAAFHDLSRLRAVAQYRASCSMQMKSLPVARAATAVVHEPAKPSSTIPPRGAMQETM